MILALSDIPDTNLMQAAARADVSSASCMSSTCHIKWVQSLTRALLAKRSWAVRFSWAEYFLEMSSKADSRPLSSKICMKLRDAESGLLGSNPRRDRVRKRSDSG